MRYEKSSFFFFFVLGDVVFSLIMCASLAVTGNAAIVTANRSTPSVKSSQIQSATLHNSLPLYLHTYIWPFLFVWPVFFAIYLSTEYYSKYIGGPEWTFVWAGSIITIQSLTWLTTKWNVNFDALFTTLSAKEVNSAQHIKVIPVTNAGSAEICPLIRDTVSKPCRNSPWRIAHQDSRVVAKEESPFSSRNGGSSMMKAQTALRPCHMRLTRSLDRLCAVFKLRKA